jgi:lysophospholipase L1-like esterase
MRILFKIGMVSMLILTLIGVGQHLSDDVRAQDPTASPTSAPSATPVPGVAPYFSLGDSIADAEGASSRELGYVPLFAAEAWAILGLPGDPSQRGDFGRRGGETSTSMLAPGGQLDIATAEIRRRNSDGDPSNDVQLITLDIGGNDFRSLTRSTSPCRTDITSQACQQAVAEVTATFTANYPVILQRIRESAGPDAIVIAMAFYNPFSGTGQPLDAPGDLVAEAIGGEARSAAVAPPVNAVWVDLFALFRGQAPELTHIADDPSDIHPNDAGHAAIAGALAAALRDATADTKTPVPPQAGSGGGGGAKPVPIALLAAGLLLIAGGASVLAVGVSGHGTRTTPQASDRTRWMASRRI